MNGFSVRRQKEKISIGVLGVGPGCGATHLVLALANYLESGVCKRTAVIELSGQQELGAMLGQEGNDKNELLGVRYYTGVHMEEIPELFQQGHEAFVLDLGTDYGSARAEFLRCDRSIVIGSISPWKVAGYENFLQQMEYEPINQWELLALFGNKKDKRRIEKRYGVQIISVPQIENPFCLKQRDIAFLQKIV